MTYLSYLKHLVIVYIKLFILLSPCNRYIKRLGKGVRSMIPDFYRGVACDVMIKDKICVV